MTYTREEALGLLVMSEDEQIRWLRRYGIINLNESLADLAFRMRDEIDEKDVVLFLKALDTIPVCGESALRPSWYYLLKCKPIHWIVAAQLAAKEDK